ncbi:RimJ/RimL family protein N-acetyltransferase [Streptacidiphilus sp. MAP12-20]|uniref:GNAT family N-acetyltransferase n=1 Tax=Streptacidiphilus sp. MAP12-20 TaxID=3156299 RepID=UPI00351236C5
MKPGDAVLRTPRLLLAAPGPEHADDVLRLARDPEVALWNPLRGVVDEASALNWCVQSGDWGDGTHATFLVFESRSDTGSDTGKGSDDGIDHGFDHGFDRGIVIGNIAVHSISERSASAQVGYRVAPQARGRGIAGEALRAVSAWAFEAFGLVRLELCHAAENPASCRVASRAGYLHEGTLRQSYRYGDGRLHDEHIHGRLVTDDVS